jgi:hypothetical protein
MTNKNKATNDDLWLIDFRACEKERNATIWIRDKRTKVWIRIDGNRTRIRKVADLVAKTLNEERA